MASPGRADPQRPDLSAVPTPQLHAAYPDATTIAIAGDVDMATAWLFERHITHALSRRPPPSCIVIDLRAVTFLAAAGLGVLTRVRSEALKQGTKLILRGVERRAIAVPLQAAGLMSQFLVE